MFECDVEVKKVGFDKKKLTITLEADPIPGYAHQLAGLAARTEPELPLEPPNPLCVCSHVRRIHKGDVGQEDGVCLAPLAAVGSEACPWAAFDEAETPDVDDDESDDSDDDEDEEDGEDEAADAPEKVDTGEGELRCVSVTPSRCTCSTAAASRRAKASQQTSAASTARAKAGCHRPRRPTTPRPRHHSDEGDEDGDEGETSNGGARGHGHDRASGSVLRLRDGHRR